MEDLKTITHAIFSASIHLTPSGSLLKSVGESFESEFRRNHLVWNPYTPGWHNLFRELLVKTILSHSSKLVLLAIPTKRLLSWISSRTAALCQTTYILDWYQAYWKKDYTERSLFLQFMTSRLAFN